MAIKRLAFMATLAVAIAALPALSRPQDMSQVRHLAWQLSAQADRALRSIQNESNRNYGYGGYGAQNPDLVNAVRMFNDSAKRFAKATDTANNPQVLGGRAQDLINQASNVDNLLSQGNYGSISNRFQSEWSNIDNTLQNLAGNYNLAYSPARQLPRGAYGGYNGGGNPGYYGGQGQGGPNGGFFEWRGTVDGSDLIHIQGNRVWIDHLSANPIQDSSFNLPSPLPRGGVPLNLRKIRGRGNVQLVEQPSPQNRYTATVRIDDPQGGADRYVFQLTW